MGCNLSTSTAADNECRRKRSQNGHAGASYADHRHGPQSPLGPIPPASELGRRSSIKKETAFARAEALLAQTAGKKFHDNYVRPTLVSYGASCKVLTAFNKVTNQKVAVKTIPKDHRKPEKQYHNVLNEIGIMKEVEDHPNGVKLLEVYNDANSYYLVMECCDGGELFEHIAKEKEGFTERQAAQILRSLMLYLAHMHAKGIAHMDVKPENIMFDNEGAAGVLKVIDFGSSVYVQPNEQVRDAFGTVRYSSPEMANDIGIGQKTDVWSAGVVMYYMLCGSAPFLKKDEVDTLNLIKNKPKVKFSGSRWASISQAAKDCIRAMLEPDPELRPTSSDVLQMPWLRLQVPDTTIRNDILQHLRSFANQSRMRRMLLGLMASNLSGAEANRLLNQFYSMDSDFSGTIELQELAGAAKQVLPDLSEEEISRMFQALDVDHTGTVDVKEFFAGLLHTMDVNNQAQLAQKSFMALDRQRSGFVTKDAFVEAMIKQAKASGYSDLDTSVLEHELENEFRALDVNSDGVLSFDEFKALLVVNSGRISALSRSSSKHRMAARIPSAHMANAALTATAAAGDPTVNAGGTARGPDDAAVGYARGATGRLPSGAPPSGAPSPCPVSPMLSPLPPRSRRASASHHSAATPPFPVSLEGQLLNKVNSLNSINATGNAGGNTLEAVSNNRSTSGRPPLWHAPSSNGVRSSSGPCEGGGHCKSGRQASSSSSTAAGPSAAVDGNDVALASDNSFWVRSLLQDMGATVSEANTPRKRRASVAAAMTAAAAAKAHHKPLSGALSAEVSGALLLVPEPEWPDDPGRTASKQRREQQQQQQQHPLDSSDEEELESISPPRACSKHVQLPAYLPSSDVLDGGTNLPGDSAPQHTTECNNGASNAPSYLSNARATSGRPAVSSARTVSGRLAKDVCSQQGSETSSTALLSPLPPPSMPGALIPPLPGDSNSNW